MARRKPASSKQRKAELQLKRAIKRGDIPAPPPQPKPPRGHRARPPRGVPTVSTADPSSKRLQSAFLKVEPEFLEKSKYVAATERLPRPLPRESAVLDAAEVAYDKGGQLTCPKRPKWRFDMAKKEVERNEEGVYQKWMSEVDAHIEAWRRTEPEITGPKDAVETSTSSVANIDASPSVPASPTYYERNLEVWRQLWRVSEISQIILLLLDSRCPAIHFPPSLDTYLASLKPPRPVVLILTKSDLVPPSYTAAWTAWLRDRHPSVRVVKVESYRAQDVHQERKGQGQRKKFEPEMKPEDLRELVAALQAAHAELLAPPEKIKNNEEKLKNWKPCVPQVIDWDAALRGGHAQVDHNVDDESQEFMTVGLIGQPNVGKSSLLNALFGTHKVKASRTPGKTKHFQTLFWTPHIRFVDCPGLVMPNFVHMELQVLCGILPISQIPSIPACIHYALRLLPLEQILQLAHPLNHTAAPLDKRTWRGERPSQKPEPAGKTTWTAMDVLTAYAMVKGWVTAKAGRPDTNRAGNALLRALAEAKIRWAFWPPDVSLPREGLGIWLGDLVEHEDDDDDDYPSDASSSADEDTAEDSSATSEELEAEVERETTDLTGTGIGRFGALSIEENEEDPD
ncbi:hypothetical protein JB92DRAFT_2923353 [Gautieria morchelliformis]|nr:hypothetical protein JB92DRAFT_2923353 [Gautieria morchelliformis]